MSWAGIASNQTVTCNNLQDAVNNGIFYQKNTIPATNKCITKAEAEYYVDINTISGKSSNQLVVKSNLVSPGYYYQMERYDCANCLGDEVFIVGYSTSPMTLNYYYASIAPYSYQRQAQIASTTIDINFTGVTGTASCPTCASYTYNIVAYNGFVTVSGTYTTKAGVTNTSFSFYNSSSSGGVVGSVCAREGTVNVTSGNGTKTQGSTC